MYQDILSVKSQRKNSARYCKVRRNCTKGVGAPAGFVGIIMIYGIFCNIQELFHLIFCFL